MAVRPARSLAVWGVRALVAALVLLPRLLDAPAAATVPHRVVPLLALPPDAVGVDVAAVEHEVGLAVNWLEQQTGRRLNVARAGVDVVVRTMPVGATSSYPDDDFTAAQALTAEARAHLADARDELPLVVAAMGTDRSGRDRDACGWGGQRTIVVFLGNCHQSPSQVAAFGSLVSAVVAHELVHALGAVGPCAPNYLDGHVSGPESDLMSATDHRMAAGGKAYVLDAGRDDYFAHGRPGCADILDSPLWAA